MQGLSDDYTKRIQRRERLVLFILAAVQFTTIVDFMIVMPLGPQLMRTLNIGTAEFGLIVSSYTFAAGFSGLLASAVVDRFARRSTFMVLYAGFLLGTLLCAIAPSYFTLVAARTATGIFGGILGGMAMTIVGDVFPEERRGRATGALMTGFALASVAGVPLGLFLGNNFGWHVPFIALVIAGVPLLVLTPYAMPPLNEHLGKVHSHPIRSIIETFSFANHLNAFALTVALMMGSFSVFPYVSAFFVANVGMTEQQLPVIYIVGGALTLVASPIVGKLTDQYGKLTIYRIIAPMSGVLLLAITHLPRVHVAIAVCVFGALMVTNVGRMIAAMAMITGSVEPHRRGGFLSANAAVQHMACGVASYLGGVMITQTADNRIEHFGHVGWMAALFTMATLWLAGRVRLAENSPITAQSISLAAAAEAAVDASEPIAIAADQD
ncbi:MFS transporter [Schlesneria paludicola]|uniref:MFS transporter n=1 Tax=Schlesneria paludicola TaxID=360056 RepID=UPI00029AE4B3|nr:MFS transporter [Schlesneria paludicola]